MKSNLIVLAGYYGFGNAGDELILHSLVSKLRRENPALQITVLSRHPDQTRTSLKVEAAQRWSPIAWVLPLLRAKRFLLGGGGLLQESTGPWNHTYYLGLLLIAKVFGCHTEVHAIGVDPSSFLNRTLTRWILNHAADSISVRDDDSHRALRMAGVTRSIDVVQDPIFDYPMPSVTVDHARIGLAIAAWPARLQWVEEVAGLCDRLQTELKCSIELFIFFPEQEEGLNQSIAQACKIPVTIHHWKSPEELPERIAACTLVVGMRYHALALAAVAGRPFIGWGFQRKVRSLCQQFNCPFRSFDQPWNAKIVFDQIRESYEAIPRPI